MNDTTAFEKYWVNGSGTSHPYDNPPSRAGLRRNNFYLYLTTNELTGTFYVGQHHTDPDDHWRSYMGSGSYLKTEARAYGVRNFSKKLLGYADTRLEAKFKEARFIAKALEKPGYCYNSNAAENVNRDPADNLRHFAFKASFRGRKRLEFNLTMTERAIAEGLDHAAHDDLEELRAGWELALQIKDERFAATNRLDPKDWGERIYGFDPNNN